MFSFEMKSIVFYETLRWKPRVGWSLKALRAALNKEYEFSLDLKMIFTVLCMCPWPRPFSVRVHACILKRSLRCSSTAPRPGKRKCDGDVLEVMRQLEEEQMEGLRRDYEQRERHFQLLLQHIKEEFSVRQEEAAQARRQQREFQQGVLTLLSQLVHVLSSRTVPSSSSPPLD